MELFCGTNNDEELSSPSAISSTLFLTLTQRMALEGIDTVLFQLKDKETQQDINHDEEHKQKAGDDYIPMTTRRELLCWWYVKKYNINYCRLLCFLTKEIECNISEQSGCLIGPIVQHGVLD